MHNGTARIENDRTVLYTPRENYFGTGRFRYEIRDARGLTATATAEVEIDAVNDAPQFPSTAVSLTVPENATGGDNVGAPVTATDVDGDTLTYRLSGTDAVILFDIGVRNGQITVADAVAFSTGDNYTVAVEADDPSGATASTDVTITVVTKEDMARSSGSSGGGGAPTISSSSGGGSSSSGGGGSGAAPLANRRPSFKDGSRTTRTAAENSPPGTNIGSPVAANDRDGDSLTYTLGGTDADAFDLDTSTGQLITKAALDYETKDTYTVSLQVRDDKDPEGEPDAATDDRIRVTISILDRDEPGHITLSGPTPRIGAPLRAAVDDPDGAITDVVWTWERSSDHSDWTPIQDATGSAYTPTRDDENHYLRVAATYTDTHAAGRTAAAAADHTVTAGHATSFDDTTPEGTHTPAISALAADGLFVDTGCGPNLFCPDDPIQRWEVAIWLIRALGEDPDTAGVSRFHDITNDQWWIRYVEQLAERNITLGCSTDPPRYCPNQPVTRAQMASFLVRAFQLPPAEPPTRFNDTANNAHAADIDTLAAAGITLGCSTDPPQFCPNQPVTRAQMASFLHRALTNHHTAT